MMVYKEETNDHRNVILPRYLQVNNVIINPSVVFESHFSSRLREQSWFWLRHFIPTPSSPPTVQWSTSFLRVHYPFACLCASRDASRKVVNFLTASEKQFLKKKKKSSVPAEKTTFLLFTARVGRFCRADVSRTRHGSSGDLGTGYLAITLPHPGLLPVVLAPRASGQWKTFCSLWNLRNLLPNDTQRYARKSVQYCPCHTRRKPWGVCVCARTRVGVEFQRPCSGRDWESRCIPPVNKRPRGGILIGPNVTRSSKALPDLRRTRRSTRSVSNTKTHIGVLSFPNWTGSNWGIGPEQKG